MIKNTCDMQVREANLLTAHCALARSVFDRWQRLWIAQKSSTIFVQSII